MTLIYSEDTAILVLLFWSACFIIMTIFVLYRLWLNNIPRTYQAIISDVEKKKKSELFLSSFCQTAYLHSYIHSLLQELNTFIRRKKNNFFISNALISSPFRIIAPFNFLFNLIVTMEIFVFFTWILQLSCSAPIGPVYSVRSQIPRSSVRKY
jgi:hypothetical protein